MSRRMMAVALGVASVAGGVIVIHALSGPAKISLSSNASHEGMGHMGHWQMWPGMSRRAGDSLGDQPGMVHGSFTTIDNQGDPTFNQLLGINNNNVIAGYFGSGAAGHPNKGYLLRASRQGAMFRSENFPGAMQTQVTGLNDRAVSVGFWSGQNTASQTNDNFGFYTWHGRFHNANFPTLNNAKPATDQLLGVNDRDVAVGFYNNGQGASRAYEYSILTHQFRRVLIPGVRNLSKKVSVTAAAINNRGDVAGFYSVGGGTTFGFLKTAHGRFFRLAFPGASSTQAFGVNDWREVAGTYMMGSGNNAKSYGFTWSPFTGFRTISDPMGVGTTLINGINDFGELVGFYTDSAGNTDGFVWSPFGHGGGMPAPSTSATPSLSATPSTSATPTTSVRPTTSATPTTSTSVPAPAPSATSSTDHW
jgi:hypothetical protein